MIVVKPIVITGAMLTATDVAEADYAAWSGATTYALGNRAILTSTHKVYESLQASNLNHDPATSPTWWAEVSPTNRWKAFDLSNSTQTAKATSLYYELLPAKACSSVAALNLAGAQQIRIRMTDPSFGLVYDKTTDLVSIPEASTWYDWFFGARVEQTQHLANDLPTYPNATIRIDLTGGATLAVGVLLLGQQHAIGDGVNYGARLGIRDYSRKETNEWGDVVLIQRAFAKLRGFSVQVPTEDLDRVEMLLTSLRATPALWIGDESYAALSIYGWYSSFEVLVSYPTYADCNIEIEGLT